MKKVLFSWLMLMAAIVNAQITLGSAASTTQGSVPIDSDFSYSYTQQIFTKQEIHANAAGTVTGLKFYLPATANISNSTSWTVYLGHTTKTAFSSTTDWAPFAGLTEVFSGVIAHTNGVVEIVFTTPFVYNNVDNLVVAVDENTVDSNDIVDRFYYYSGVSNSSLYYRNNTTNPAPATPAAGTRSSQKSRITLEGLTLDPLPFCAGLNTPTAGQTGLPLKTRFTWNEAGGANGYRLSIGTAAGASDVLNNFDMGNTLEYTLTAAQQLNPTTQYFYKITAYNTAGNAVSCSERDFTTTTAPPANDDCANAVSLTVNPDINCTVKTAGTTLGATQSMDAAPCSGIADDDVWYSFVATSAAQYIALSDIVSVGPAGNSIDTYFQVLSGTCGTLMSVKCSDPSFNTVGGLIPGETYYIRVYSFSGTGFNQSFNICVSTPPPPPANDDCSGAVVLTVNPDLNCGVVTAGTTEDASQSMPAAPCTGGEPDDDVWYSFVATSTKHRISLSDIVSTGVNTSTDMYFQVFSGGSCGSATSLLCSNDEQNTVTGLTVGEVYFIRVYSLWSIGFSNTFKICVGTYPPPPANDDCANAVALTPSDSDAFTGAVFGSTASATANTQTAPTCNATGVNDDVWYSFKARAATHVVHVLYDNSSPTTTQVYSGVCGNLVTMSCMSGERGNSNILLQNLVAGQTYYVRVFSTDTAVNTYSNFQIAVTTPSAVNNDTCATATAVTCNSIMEGSNALAGNDTLPASTCGSGGTTASYKGVWFKVVASQNGPITLDACGTQYDAYLRVYTGDCTALTCFNNTSGIGFNNTGCTNNSYSAPKLTFNGVAGTTYYVLLTGFTAARLGNYKLTVTGCTNLSANESVKDEDGVKISPNPFTDVLTLSDVSKVKSVSVLDASGKLVKTFDKAEAVLNLNGLTSGMYVVVLTMKDGSKQTVKVLKK